MFFFQNVFEDEKDTGLIDKLTTQDELSGLLNLALFALKQLIRDNGFAYIDDIKTVTKDYTSDADSITKFLEEKCAITGKDEDYKICRDLWSAYFNFCKQNNLHCKAFNVFGMELSDKITKRRIRIKGELEHCYIGIKLKDETKQD